MTKEQRLMRELEIAYKRLAKYSKCKTFTLKRTKFGTFVYENYKREK